MATLESPTPPQPAPEPARSAAPGGRLGRWLLGALFGAVVVGAGVALADDLEPVVQIEGGSLFANRCAGCHEDKDGRAPSQKVIGSLPRAHLVEVMTYGAMRPHAVGLSAAQIGAIAAFITNPNRASIAAPREPDLKANLCTFSPPAIRLETPGAWNGWGVDLANSRYQRDPGLTAADLPRLKPKWVFALPGGRAHVPPTVVGDRMFVVAASGDIIALDPKTGCTFWSTRVPDAATKTPVVVSQVGGAPVLFVGGGRARIYALEPQTGAVLWNTQVETHPRARISATPMVSGNRVYVTTSATEESAAVDPKYECCTFRGAALALDAQTGRILWKTYVLPPAKRWKVSSIGTQLWGPSGAAMWGGISIDPKRRLLFTGTSNDYVDVTSKVSDAVIAFDLDTGKIRWVTQVTPGDAFNSSCKPGARRGEACPDEGGPDYDFGAPPVPVTLKSGRTVLLAGQKSGLLYGLNPDTGARLWETRVGKGGIYGGIEFGFSTDGVVAYAPNSDHLATPPDKAGGVTAVDVATGKILWHTPAPAAVCGWGVDGCTSAQAGASAVIPGAVFAGGGDGKLRAYDPKTGRIFWEVDTLTAPLSAVNGIDARAGSLEGGLLSISGGAIYVPSGYGGFAGRSGNALIAYTVDGR